MGLAQAHIRAGVITQANSTGTKLTTLHNKKDLCNKNITFVNKITLNNKYAKQTILVCGKKTKKQKKRKKYSKEYLKVFEIIACLNGMYEALHIRS